MFNNITVLTSLFQFPYLVHDKILNEILENHNEVGSDVVAF